MKTVFKNALLVGVSGACLSAVAAPTYDEAYTSLRNNPNNYSWTQERSISSVNFANMVLCFIKKSGSDKKDAIGRGPYVAAVQEGSCDLGSNNASTDGQTTAQTRYSYAVVRSDYDAASQSLQIKFWMRPSQSELEKAQSDNQRQAEATHVTIKISLPANEIGFDQVTWIGFPADKVTGIPTTYDFNQAISYGTMVPTTSGSGFNISMVNWEKNKWTPANGVTKWLNLARTGPRGQVSLVGTVQDTEWSNTAQADVEAKFKLNATDTEFIRSRYNSTNASWDAPICFDRTSFKFTTWNYNLYTEAGALVDVKSNVDVTYAANNGTSYRGNYSNDNFWMPDAAQSEIATKGTVNVDVQDQAGAKKAGVVKVNNGSLRKVINTQTSLSDLDHVILNYWKCPSDGSACSNVPIAWRKDLSQFVTASNGAISSSAVASADFPRNDFWFNSNGINYVIRAVYAQSGNTWAADWSSTNLNNNTKIFSRQEKKLTTAELNALNGVTLNCVGNCPMWDSNTSNINTYNAGKQYVVSGSLNQGLSNGTTFGYTYTFNPTSGKLYNDAQQTALEYTAFKNSSVATAKSMQSGPLIPANAKSLADLSKASKCSASDADANTTNVCPWNYENTLAEYYIWRTGERQWEKDWSLTVDGSTPKLDDRMSVTYTCPANHEGCSQGSKTVLDYNGPGRLWGVPNKCVDADNYSLECSSSTQNQQWINKFNLTASAVNADKSTDFVLDSKGVKYFVLPQGSGEYYPQKNSCSLTLGDARPEVRIADLFNRTLVDVSPAPLNALTDDVTVRDGELVSN